MVKFKFFLRLQQQLQATKQSEIIYVSLDNFDNPKYNFSRNFAKAFQIMTLKSW